MGEAGSVPPWELTDAIDRGDAATALDKLQRMLGAGGRHPLQLMVTLHAHFERMLRLHGSDATNEAQAAAVLGLKGSTFPARKALTRVKALGPGRLSRALLLLADADLALRGQQGWPPEQVLEVLVARLARLAADQPADADRPQTGGAVGARQCRPVSSGVGREPGDPPHQPALVPRRLVLVDDTLGGGLVDALHRDPQHLGRHVVAVARRDLGVAPAGLQLGTGRLVALTAGLVLAVPLDLGLDVGHGSNDSTRRARAGTDGLDNDSR